MLMYFSMRVWVEYPRRAMSYRLYLLMVRLMKLTDTESASMPSVRKANVLRSDLDSVLDYALV